jgi:hypothetical protein
MRRLLALVALLVVVGAPLARAQSDDGYSSSWIDPTPSTERDAKPLGYLDGPRPIVGQVSHPNGIQSVSAVLVLDPNNPPPDGCGGDVQQPTTESNGTSMTFRIEATFPCNLVYEIRATAQANAGGGLGGSTPGPHVMPLLVAVAIPPAPVASVDATLTTKGDDRTVRLEWPAGAEPDLLGYVVTREVDGKSETLGQVAAGEHTRWIDTDPPVGTTVNYEVTSVRNGPDGDVEQVPSAPTMVAVDVPGAAKDDDASAGSDGATSGGSTAGGDSGETSHQTGLASSGRATSNGQAPGSLSSVRARAGSPAGPSGPPTTLDTGFSETIDYGDPATVSEDGPAEGSAVALFDESTGGSPWSDKETMSFVAGGLAVLMGAVTILTVTRRAARAAY